MVFSYAILIGISLIYYYTGQTDISKALMINVGSIKVALSNVGSSSRGNTSDTSLKLSVRCRTIGSGLIIFYVE